MKKVTSYLIMSAMGMFVMTVGARVGCLALIGYDQEGIEALHPARYFGVVQALCAQVETDLEVVTVNPELQLIWGNQTDYLIEQFLRLYTSVANLIGNRKEARSYLLEDAQFLIGLVDIVYDKYRNLLGSKPQMNHDVLMFLGILMRKSRQKAQELLSLNQEIIAPNYLLTDEL